MSFKVAICDDDRILCKTIEDYIILYAKNNSLDITTNHFFSGYDLIESATEANFDLIILDIGLDDINGVEVGKYIRNVLNNQLVQILYISGSTNYAIDLFVNRPLNFLVKPIDQHKLEQELSKAINITSDTIHSFQFQKERSFFSVAYSNILYLESNDKKITLHTLTGEDHTFYGKLSSIANTLPSDYFFLIHKSYLINYIHLFSSDYETITLVGGITLPISQSHRKEIRSKLIKRRKNF